MADDTALMPFDTAVDRSEPARPAPGSQERRVARALSGRQKAAVIVRLLLNEGADIPLEELPEDLQEILTHQMGRMGLIDRLTLAAVAEEFTEALQGIGLSFPHGLADALTAMDGRIAASTAARLRREAGVRQIGDPWARLRALPATDLAAMARAESTEVAAVLLSKLETEKAAELLGHLPGPDARRITYAVSQTGNVTPQAVERIGWSLAGQLDKQPERAFSDDPGKRVGNILNQSAASLREQVLTGLDEQDAEFAGSVRKSLFTFGDIPARLAPRDVPAVTRAVDPDILVTALAAALAGDDAPVAEFLLSGMSGRLADSLREEIAEKGKIKRSEGEAAMTEVVAAIRQQEVDGNLQLIDPDADED